MGIIAVIIGIVVVFVAIVGIRPRGGRPVGNTQLMAVARVVLVGLGVVVIFFVLRR